MNWLDLASSLIMAGFAPLLFFFVGCACCSVPCGTACSSKPADITLTVGGWSNNACSTCADYNTTYVLTFDATLPNCGYSYTFDGSCSGAFNDSINCTIAQHLGLFNPRATINQIFRIAGGGSYTTTWVTGDLAASNPISCNGYGMFTTTSRTGHNATQCNHDGSQVTGVM